MALREGVDFTLELSLEGESTAFDVSLDVGDSEGREFARLVFEDQVPSEPFILSRTAAFDLRFLLQYGVNNLETPILEACQILLVRQGSLVISREEEGVVFTLRFGKAETVCRCQPEEVESFLTVPDWEPNEKYVNKGVAELLDDED